MNGNEEGSPMNYLTIETAATRLKCSTNAVRRVAKNNGLGILADGHRLVAISEKELPFIKPHLHKTSGNPDWIAAGKAKTRSRRRKPA
jgi:excisionase family DNA binding protein